MSMISKTIKWFQTAGQIPLTPAFITRQAAFYTGMQCEELAEKLAAVFGSEDTRVSVLQALGGSLKKGLFDNKFAELTEAQKLKLLDGDLDQLWVTLGSLAAQGVDAEGAWNEVARANWDKFPGGVVTRDAATGKVQKPEGWRAPDLKPFLHGAAK